MSWPADGLPRFKVGSVTGGRIRPGENLFAVGGHALGPTFYIFDRAYAHRVVWESSSREGVRNARRHAERLAAKWNAEDEERRAVHSSR